jgi:hypothetical protein
MPSQLQSHCEALGDAQQNDSRRLAVHFSAAALNLSCDDVSPRLTAPLGNDCVNELGATTEGAIGHGKEKGSEEVARQEVDQEEGCQEIDGQEVAEEEGRCAEISQEARHEEDRDQGSGPDSDPGSAARHVGRAPKHLLELATT